MLDFWLGCGWQHLHPDHRGRLPPSPAWLAHWLDRPELALVPESCAAEIRLHQALRADPLRPVAGADLAALADADARDNYRLFIALRDAVVAAGTLEAFYSGLFRQGAIQLPPLFIDLVVQAILRHLLEHDADALDCRAAELLFRPQRISLQNGRVLAADRATVDRLGDGLEIEAQCERDGIVEQVSHRTHPWCVGVQFHPERGRVYEPLFRSFVEACG